MAISIRTTNKDVIWNYIGTVFSMVSGLILLLLLLWFLSDEELGLWYVFTAVINLVMYFEFGFNPTFSRNIVYVLSGAKELSKSGFEHAAQNPNINWHLMNVLLKSIRLVYGVLATLALIIMGSIGTYYIWTITQDMTGISHWIAWSVFCISAFINLYYLTWSTLLRGIGDIEAENKARTVGRIAQLLLTVILLLAGLSLIGAAIGFLANGIVMRFAAKKYYGKHKNILTGVASDDRPVKRKEIQNVFYSILYIAWRDGLVQFALFGSSQAMTIVCSLTLTLAETGLYSLLLQLGTMVCTLASVVLSSSYPAFQASFAQTNISEQQQIVSRGVAAYWTLFIIGTILAVLIGIPFIEFFRSEIQVNTLLLVTICIYLGLLNNHSNACRFIISMNIIPYMPAYLVSALAGIILSYLFSGPFHWGVWGIALGQILAQLLYNNWKWPLWVSEKIDLPPIKMMQYGYSWWVTKITSLVTGPKA